VFAAIGVLTFGEMSGAIVLALAAAGWLVVTLLGYALAWLR
jgi:hypothetical protein